MFSGTTKIMQNFHQFENYVNFYISFFHFFKAIIWIKDPLLHEVSVSGLRQGVTKKNFGSSKAR